MVSNKKQEENEQIENEEKDILNSMKQNIGSFTQLLEDEQIGKKKALSLKEKLKKEKEDKQRRNAQIEEMNELTNKMIIDKFRTDGNSRIQYMRAQKDYFRYFAHSKEARNDPLLYDYRRKLKSEVQLIVMKNIHYPILSFALVYFIIRKLKSGYITAVSTAGAFSLYMLSVFYNTQCRYPFEIAYPAHPKVNEKRQLAIAKCCYYHPEIMKFELEYLNKKVFKEGYK